MQSLYRFQEVWFPFIISVKKRYKFPLRLQNTPVARGRDSPVFLVDYSYARIGYRPNNIFSAILRSVVDDYQFSP
jgi:hypothetical protein